MLLSVLERIALFDTLPQEGDIVTLHTVRALREQIAFTEDELKRWNVRSEGNHWFWDTVDKDKQPVPQEVEFDVSKRAQKLVREQLEKLNVQKKLRDQHLSLCDKFGVSMEE